MTSTDLPARTRRSSKRALLAAAAVGYLAAVAVERMTSPKPGGSAPDPNTANDPSLPNTTAEADQSGTAEADQSGTAEADQSGTAEAGRDARGNPSEPKEASLTAKNAYMVVLAGVGAYALFVLLVVTKPSLWPAGPDVVLGGLFAVLLLAQAALYKRTSSHPWRLALLSVALPIVIFWLLLSRDSGLTLSAIVGGIICVISALGAAWLERQSPPRKRLSKNAPGEEKSAGKH